MKHRLNSQRMTRLAGERFGPRYFCRRSYEAYEIREREETEGNPFGSRPFVSGRSWPEVFRMACRHLGMDAEWVEKEVR
jgi:hypothetical protein